MSEFNIRSTVFVPETTFSMQSVGTEAAILPAWSRFYEQMAGATSRMNRFMLHDGPPYANGDIHMGHAMNKILKDFVTRSKYASGLPISFVPGWDCHGLPIETQVEIELLAEGLSKDSLSVPEFRARCRAYAARQINAQREQFKSLGVLADWDNPYVTMDFKSEADIAARLHMFLMGDMLYRGTKPVWWSTVEKTALAEAEVEYHPIKVTSAHVGYPVPHLNAMVLIWTTTPWTLPASFAIAFNKDAKYSIYEVKAGTGLATVGTRFVIGDDAVAETMAAIDVTEYDRVEAVEPQYLSARHPMRGEKKGYLWAVPLIPGKHVRADSGTGFVHTAPDHGPEDFVCWNECNMGDFGPMIDDDGTYLPHVAYFAGKNVLNKTPKGDYIFEFTNADVLNVVRDCGHLFSAKKVEISYAHSWRSKAPLINRSTPQWFMEVSDETRASAIKSLDDVTFLPETGKARLADGMATRPDWLISRQRVWGTPLAIFVHKETGEPAKSDTINSNIYSAFVREGGDAWWKYEKAHWFVGSALNPDDYDQVMDVLDVWFDSGSSLALVDAPCDEALAYGASRPFYLEGSDQHRGWFGSSLLVNVAATDNAPFSTVLTHGFALDAKGEKMSKSKGNVVDPLVEAEKYGMDTLRLWVAMSDYTQDVRIGPKILDGAAAAYKKFRLTLRYLTGSLQGWSPMRHGVQEENFPALERYMMHRLRIVRLKVQAAYDELDFNEVVRLLSDYCNNDLSAFFFDVRKDSLYCDRPDSLTRRSYQTVLANVFDALLEMLQPIIPFTVHEAQVAYGMLPGPMRFDLTEDPVSHKHVLWTLEVACHWPVVGELNAALNAALEPLRREKVYSTSFDTRAEILVSEAQKASVDALVADGANIAELLRVSAVSFLVHRHTVQVPIHVKFYPADGVKCERSRRYFTDVGSNPDYPTLSARDADAVEYWKTTHV